MRSDVTRILHAIDQGDTVAAVATQRRALSLMPEGLDPAVATRLAEYESSLPPGAESGVRSDP